MAKIGPGNAEPSRLTYRRCNMKYGLTDQYIESLYRKYKVCIYCQKKMTVRKGSAGPQGKSRTIEHLNHRGNSGRFIAACCGSCNSSRGNKPLRKWFASKYCLERGINEDSVHAIVDEYLKKHEPIKKRSQMSIRQLQMIIRDLKDQTPITSSFDEKLFHQGQAHRNKWWNSHKEHWIDWLKQYNGPGYKNRKNKSIRSANIVYNRLACPPMLLWLIEASGINKSKIKDAVKAALASKKIFTAQSASIRAVVSWEEIERNLYSK